MTNWEIGKRIEEKSAILLFPLPDFVFFFFFFFFQICLKKTILLQNDFCSMDCAKSNANIAVWQSIVVGRIV